MAAAARYTANYTRHARYTTRNTTCYTTRYTAEIGQRQHFGSGQKNLTCILFPFLESLKLQNVALASSSVVLRVVLRAVLLVVLRGAATRH